MPSADPVVTSGLRRGYPSPTGSPLRGRYLVRNPVWNGWLHVTDLVSTLLHGRRNASGESVAPRRLLLAVGGHLGDAVIATGMLPLLSRRFPGVEIGVLCASWNRTVFESHTRVRQIHVVDHWKLNRGQASLFARWRATRRSRKAALAEIRDARYDTAIDLASHYPNSARLLRDAGIPVRIGYESGGGGPHYSSAQPWSARGHVIAEHMALVDRLGPAPFSVETLGYELTDIAASAVARADARLAAGGLSRGSYAVVHVGPGHERKEWPLENWKAVSRELAALSVGVVLTGSGSRQMALGRELAAAAKGTVDLTGQLDWNEFRAVIAGARLVLSVDTVTMHLAAAEGVPCIALMTGMDRPDRWQPLGRSHTVLTESVPCAPCFRSRGCEAMSCIRDITVTTVMRAVVEHLALTRGEATSASTLTLGTSRMPTR